ncbi:MAG: DUF2933 domain-containing protein [Acidobacteriota bacterium]
MDQPHHHHQDDTGRASFWKSPPGIALAMVGVIAGFFVLREHWAHVVGNLSYLLLLACPLMHLFGHGHGHGHGHHHGDDAPQGGSPSDQNKP